MVFLSEASIREMVQEALGGGGYPTLDGDGNFPIIPSPLAEPVVTKLALQPVRVMRVPTDKNEFEFAVKELINGVESDHLPTLFLKMRELVNDFSAPQEQISPCPEDCSPKDDLPMQKNSPDNDVEVTIRSEVRKLVKGLLAEAGEAEEDPLKRWKKLPPRRTGLWGSPPKPSDADLVDDFSEDDHDMDLGDYDDAGSAESDPTDPYPDEYLKNPGYPDIGEDPDFSTWEDLERDIANSAWEPEAELDKFRGRDSDLDKVEAPSDDVVAPVAKKKEAVGGMMDWDAIGKALDISHTTAHGVGAIGARKLSYVSEYMGRSGFDEFYENCTDRFIDFLIKVGSEIDNDKTSPGFGKPYLSMSDVMLLRSASKFATSDEEGEPGEQSLDAEAVAARDEIQKREGFREFVNASLEHEMKLDGYAVSHKDAAKNKDQFSVFHRMKSTTR